MGTAALKRKPQIVNLARHIPKKWPKELEAMDIYEIGRLERVQESKLKAPVRNEQRKVRDGEPSLERRRHAGGAFQVGGDDKVGQKFTMQDSPLDRMRARDAIGAVEYSALRKYAHHWYHGGLLSSVGSVDLNRIFASDPGSMSGMAKTEAQAHHRQQYREARALIGHRPGIVVDNVICQEHPLEVAGYAIGWTNRPQAVAAATEMLRDAGHRLARLWGIG